MAPGKHTTLRTPVPRLVFLWLAGLVLAGCNEREAAPTAAASHHWQTGDWPVTRGGKALQGRVYDRVPRHPVVEWSFMANAPITSEATVARGVIVFGDEEGGIYAIDAKTGKERWRTETEDTVEATPAIVSDRAFVGSNDGMFRALDLATGREVWHIEGQDKFPTGGVPVTSPDSGDAWILVNGYDGVLRCLRSQDGSQVWKLETQDYINSSPAILDGGLVAFGGCDSVIHVVRLKDGTPVREVKTDAQIIRSVAGLEDTVYAVNHANQLLAAKVDGAAPSWLYENDGAQFLTSPGVDDLMVYVGSRDRHLHAVNRKSGTQMWKFQTGGRVESSPLVFDDAVVFGSNDGRLYAVSKTDGSEIWRLDLGEGLANAPAFADGRIVIGGGDGTLFVIRGGPRK